MTANGFTAETSSVLQVHYEYDRRCKLPAILNKPDVAFYCSPKTAGALMQALAAAGSNQGINMLGVNQAFPSLVPRNSFTCPGMFDDALVLTYEDNLVVGSNEH